MSIKEWRAGQRERLILPVWGFSPAPCLFWSSCCQMLDMTLTERWRHHIGILPLRLPAALPPVCLHQRLISSLLLLLLPTFVSPSLVVAPFLRYLLHVCLFFLTFSILCLETFLMIITLTFLPSSPNLQVLIAGRTWKSQLAASPLASISPQCNAFLSAIFIFFLSFLVLVFA